MRESVEMLGYPAGSRVLLVNGDDVGIYRESNTAVIESIDNGITGSCSLMVPCPGATDALEILVRRPDLCVGVHLTLLADFQDTPWDPVAEPGAVSSLLDASGRFRSSDDRADLLALARTAEVEREFRAQIQVALDAGITPTHLDWHCLADGGRDDIFDLTLGLADEHGMAVRAWLEPARDKLRRRGLPVLDHDFLDSFSLDPNGRATRCAQLLRELRPGLSEWAVHPSAKNQADQSWRVRRGDYNFLVSAQARAIVEQEEIILIDYRTILRAWQS